MGDGGRYHHLASLPSRFEQNAEHLSRVCGYDVIVMWETNTGNNTHRRVAHHRTLSPKPGTSLGAQGWGIKLLRQARILLRASSVGPARSLGGAGRFVVNGSVQARKRDEGRLMVSVAAWYRPA